MLRVYVVNTDSLDTFAKDVNKFFTGTLLGKAERLTLWITCGSLY